LLPEKTLRWQVSKLSYTFETDRTIKDKRQLPPYRFLMNINPVPWKFRLIISVNCQNKSVELIGHVTRMDSTRKVSHVLTIILREVD